MKKVFLMMICAMLLLTSKFCQAGLNDNPTIATTPIDKPKAEASRGLGFLVLGCFTD